MRSFPRQHAVVSDSATTSGTPVVEETSIGKTAVATAAMYDPQIVGRFQRNRIFASLETATEARDVLAKLVEALGIPPTGDELSLMRILETSAANKPVAAVLDNAETVFEIDRTNSLRLVNVVKGIAGLSLVVTIRGTAPPIPDAVIDDLPKLNITASRDAFLAIAGQHFGNDSDLMHLLDGLDGHALSIHLVAAQAIGSPSLKGLRESWDDAHAKILRISGEAESRLTSVRASLALSLNSRRMTSTPLGRRLLSLLSLLPAGLAEADVRSVLGERGTISAARGNEAVACLYQLKLIELRPDDRLRMLTPLRESVKLDVKPSKSDRDRLVKKLLRLAAKAARLGTFEWASVSQEIEPEADNLDAICSLALRTEKPSQILSDALQGLSSLVTHSGKSGIQTLKEAADRFSSDPASPWTAQTLDWLGQAANVRSDYSTAETCFRKAAQIWHDLGRKRAEAYCIKNLANTFKNRSDREPAQAYYEEAISLSRQPPNDRIEADCALGLAQIASGRSDDGPSCRTASHRAIIGENNCL
jgi:tetratricopeptide (TPR) repeat protein